MADVRSETHYDVLQMPRNSGNYNLRMKLLDAVDRDLSKMDLQAMKVIAERTEVAVKCFGILRNKTTRAAYDQTLPSRDVYSIDASTTVKDFALGREPQLSESERNEKLQKNTRHAEEQMAKLAARQIDRINMSIQQGEQALREWRRIEIRRLTAVTPSYLAEYSQRFLTQMAKMSINPDSITEEFGHRERYRLLCERLKLLLRTLEDDRNQIKADPNTVL